MRIILEHQLIINFRAVTCRGAWGSGGSVNGRLLTRDRIIGHQLYQPSAPSCRYCPVYSPNPSTPDIPVLLTRNQVINSRRARILGSLLAGMRVKTPLKHPLTGLNGQNYRRATRLFTLQCGHELKVTLSTPGPVHNMVPSRHRTDRQP